MRLISCHLVLSTFVSSLREDSIGKKGKEKKNEKKRKKEISLQILRPEKFEKQHRFSRRTVARENGDGVGGRTGGRGDRIGR